MRGLAVVLAGGAILFAPAAGAQDEQALRAVGEGRGLYLVHCTGCHGIDAKGGVAATNGGLAPDLTQIEVRDGGFSTLHVMHHVSGGYSGTDPNQRMPRWVVHFRNEQPMGEGWALVKVLSLTRYLESIQEPSAAMR
jgi:mono/diheme cytochrome c family protein